jgi:predicted alpha/beta hydrolase
LRGFNATKYQWGRYDISAGLAELARQCTEGPIHVVGHSAGGALIGLVPNCDTLDRVVTVGCSSGYLENIAPSHRWFARFFLLVYCPLCVRLFGHVPAKWLHIGEDLPAGVASQWASWCSRPGYVANAFGEGEQEQFYQRFRGEILWIAASDDPYATPLNVDDMVRIYANATVRRLVVEPADYGLQEIGHTGFFRRECSTLWPVVLSWLRRNGACKA